MGKIPIEKKKKRRVPYTKRRQGSRKMAEEVELSNWYEEFLAICSVDNDIDFNSGVNPEGHCNSNLVGIPNYDFTAEDLVIIPNSSFFYPYDFLTIYSLYNDINVNCVVSPDGEWNAKDTHIDLYNDIDFNCGVNPDGGCNAKDTQIDDLCDDFLVICSVDNDIDFNCGVNPNSGCNAKDTQIDDLCDDFLAICSVDNGIDFNCAMNPDCGCGCNAKDTQIDDWYDNFLANYSVGNDQLWCEPQR